MVDSLLDYIYIARIFETFHAHQYLRPNFIVGPKIQFQVYLSVTLSIYTMCNTLKYTFGMNNLIEKANVEKIFEELSGRRWSK